MEYEDANGMGGYGRRGRWARGHWNGPISMLVDEAEEMMRLSF
jgi:hypothetical protein